MMERDTPIAHILRRIAAELGVPVASFYDQAGPSLSDSEAMQKAVTGLLSAFAAVCDPQELRYTVAVLTAETERLRDLPDAGDKE